MSDQPPSEQGRVTDYLNLPQGSQMVDRAETQTTPITTESRFILVIGSQQLVVQVKEELLIGRMVEGDPVAVDIDLTAQGAYKYGVSRRHAMLRLYDGTLYIQDLNSTNGTRINGSTLTPEREYRLKDGDEIEFAQISAVFKLIKEKK